MPGLIRLKARGRSVRRVPGEMNGLERRYAEHLQIRKLAGEIAEWRFDCFTLRLASRCRLTVDFFVMLSDGSIEFHDVKGYMEDDALVKMKVVAEQYWMFDFLYVTARTKKDGGGWVFHRLGE